jgi:UDP-N-acetylmuramate dehydrogenase
MIQIEENKDLSALSTFRMASTAQYFVRVIEKEQIPEALLFASKNNIQAIIIGGGSNTIFTQAYFNAVVIQIAIPGFEKIAEDDHTVVLQCGAGENWDSVVARSVEMGLSGIEALSAIPGFVGGTPVQNVGAYGTEVKDTIVTVEAYDRKARRFVTLTNTECKFAYRDSMFKNQEKGRYIIASVDFILSKKPATVPNYPGVAAYFEKSGITSPTLADIRNAIIEIRKNKLPDPHEIASVGSFFKNPIVRKSLADSLKEKFPAAVVFPVNDNQSKIGAGWMLDTLGYKGKDFGNLMCYPGNAMVIVNKGGATRLELEKLVASIQKNVLDTFGIVIEPEPILI